MRGNFFQILGVVLLCCLTACKKDKPDPEVKVLPPASIAKVLLVCEGSLGNGNASLGVYDIAADSVYPDVFAAANNQALGDVFQSMCIWGNSYLLAVNNSDQIQVVDTANFLQRAVISVHKPRYMLSLEGGRLLVGELFRNRVAIVDVSQSRLVRELEMPYKNVEGMLRKGAQIWAACWDENCKYVYLLDSSANSVVDSVLLPGYAPHSIAQDKHGNVWILAGNVYKNVPASLVCLNDRRQIVRSFLFPEHVDPIKLCFNRERDSLYFLEVNYDGGTDRNGVFKMGITQSVLPDKPFISCQSNQYFWALGIHPVTGEVFVGDPKGFVQKSSVSVYGSDGTLHRRFSCGVGISSFYFK